jgi:hypothetical protein
MAMQEVRTAFLHAGEGLRLDDAELTYTTAGQILHLTGCRADGSSFTVTTGPFSGSPVLRAMQAARDLLTQAEPLVLTDKPLSTNTTQGLAQFDRKLAKAVTQVNRMGKLQQIAQRAPQVVKNLEDRADKLGQRLDALEKRGGDTFDRWATHLSEQESAVAEAENAINQLSNGAPVSPLPGS